MTSDAIEFGPCIGISRWRTSVLPRHRDRIHNWAPVHLPGTIPPMSSATHSYYDWQLSTLLLAYDAVEPLDRDDAAALTARQQKVEMELHDLAQAVLPADYLANPGRDFPPAVVIEMTRATLRRAA